jgi:hypothetical protein
VAARDSRGMLQCSEQLVEPSRTVVPLGLLLHSGSHGARGNHDNNPEPTGHRVAEVMGAEAIMPAIPELTECHAYGMCGAIHFCAAIFLGLLFLSPALTDVRDLGPLVSV